MMACFGFGKRNPHHSYDNSTSLSRDTKIYSKLFQINFSAFLQQRGFGFQ